MSSMNRQVTSYLSSIPFFPREKFRLFRLGYMKVKNWSTAPLVPNSQTTMMKNSTLILLGLLVAVCCAAAGLLGGFQTVDTDRDDVREAAKAAAQGLSKTFSSKYHHRLHTIKEAKAQIVAGTNYKMTLIVGMTTCEKAQQTFDDSQDCEFQDDVSTYKKCTVLVYRNLKDQHKLVASGCVLVSKKDI